MIKGEVSYHFVHLSITHTHTQPFIGPLSRITQVGRYQKKHSVDHHSGFYGAGDDNGSRGSDSPRGCHPIRAIGALPPSSPTFTPNTLLATTLPVYFCLRQALNNACIPGRLVTQCIILFKAVYEITTHFYVDHLINV